MLIIQAGYLSEFPDHHSKRRGKSLHLLKVSIHEGLPDKVNTSKIDMLYSLPEL